METLMVASVRSSLHLFLTRNAIFLCERLCAEFPTELNLQLLATCYLRNDQAYCAYHILKGAKMAQSRYLFALSCYRMNLLREAEAALCPAGEPSTEIPNGAAGHYLLGLIYRFTDRRTNAIDQFRQALNVDPLLWSAYEELCALGAADEAHEHFGDTAANRVLLQHPLESSSESLQPGTENCNTSSARAIPSVGDVSPRQLKQSNAITSHSHTLHSSNGTLSNMSLYNTPSPTVMQLSNILPPPLCRNNAHPNTNTLAGDPPTRPANNNLVQAPRRKFVDEGKLRKVSGRLFSDSAPRRSTRLSGEAATTTSNALQTGGNGAYHSIKFLGGFSSSKNSGAFRSVTFRRGQSCATEHLEEDTSAETSSNMSGLPDSKVSEQQRANLHGDGSTASTSGVTNGTLELLRLLKTLAEGYKLSCTYRCKDALEAYLKLSSKQYNTGWVQSQVGKAHFELVEYFEADHAFSVARRVAPYVLEGMDVYSTVLYHLKKEMKLSYLAQELVLKDRLSPQAWCAMGNCYSLQKDHETALKNFQRAVHLDPRFAYAHTLCGHEYVALEDFENGIKCYQSALQIDERHYNSWYGLGMVHLRQEKFEFAEHNFRKALEINLRSSVLLCYLGMALHSLKRNNEALKLIEEAKQADPKNPLPMYQKANVLISLERYDEALEELEQLKECAPRESSVYALMGKVYKWKNKFDRAMFYYGLALDLKPPATDVAAIKVAVEKLFIPDEFDDGV